MPSHRAARFDALPSGRPVLITLDGRRLALVRVADTVHALDEACPHAGGPLSDGTIAHGAITCPYHGWVWDLVTGACVAPGRAVRVVVYPTRVEAGEVWVELP